MAEPRVASGSGSTNGTLETDLDIHHSETTPLIPNELSSRTHSTTVKFISGGSQSSASTPPEEAVYERPQPHIPRISSDCIPKPKGFFPGLKAQSVDLRLQNSGSVARDHLASERTFLAYVRTSLSIASAGVALAQILSFTEYFSEEEGRSRHVESYARPLGATAVVFALMVLSIGVMRYFSIQKALIKGLFPVARVAIISMAFLLGALVVATFGILVAGRLKKS